MKHIYLFRVIVVLSFLFQACNTLYNTQSVNIEVLEPGKVMFPSNYQTLAIRYNNTNSAYNPVYGCYFVDSTKFTDNRNIDSLASWIYYDYLLKNLQQQNYFEAITEIAPADYSKTNITIDLPEPDINFTDTTELTNDEVGKVNAYILAAHLKSDPLPEKNFAASKTMDPDYGLYSRADLKAITDSTEADLLLSLDHFITANSVFHSENKLMVQEIVLVNAFWTLYDLSDYHLKSYFDKNDTVDWVNYSSPEIDPFELLPERRDAVLNAADITGTRFAEFLIPHWSLAERFYYRSGHVELKQTDKLVKEGKCLEAGEIWRHNVDNSNKRIQAKCMFNLALACEMAGDMNAALDWVVRSYHVFGEKNELHAENCRNYIQVLAQRRINNGQLDQLYSGEEIR